MPVPRRHVVRLTAAPCLVTICTTFKTVVQGRYKTENYSELPSTFKWKLRIIHFPTCYSFYSLFCTVICLLLTNLSKTTFCVNYNLSFKVFLYLCLSEPKQNSYTQFSVYPCSHRLMPFSP